MEWKWQDIFTPTAKGELPSKYYGGYECPAYGYITWKGKKYPVYTDDYGCQDFIIFKYIYFGRLEEYSIAVQNMGGMLDWDWELDRMIDTYGDEEN